MMMFERLSSSFSHFGIIKYFRFSFMCRASSNAVIDSKLSRRTDNIQTIGKTQSFFLCLRIFIESYVLGSLAEIASFTQANDPGIWHIRWQEWLTFCREYQLVDLLKMRILHLLPHIAEVGRFQENKRRSFRVEANVCDKTLNDLGFELEDVLTLISF